MGWGVWVGVEIEGRLQGVRTLFLHSLAQPSDRDYVSTLWPSFGHIYVCQEWLAQYGQALLEEHVARYPQTLVTLEIDAAQPPRLSPDLIARCHLVLNVPVPEWFDRVLKPTDSVRLTGQFQTASSCKQHGWVTQPAQYTADQVLIEVTTGGQDRAVLSAP